MLGVAESLGVLGGEQALADVVEVLLLAASV